MNLIRETENYLCDVIRNIGYDISKVSLIPSSRKELGDFQINEAFALGKQNGENPRDVAQCPWCGYV